MKILGLVLIGIGGGVIGYFGGFPAVGGILVLQIGSAFYFNS